MKIRKIHIALAAAATALLALGAAAAANTWQIDPQHSAAQFSVRHLGIATVRGEFHNVQGTVLLDEADATKSEVDVTIDAASLDTREPGRDKHLRSADFFDVEKYPVITFKSTRVERAAAGKFKVTGDLTIRGVTKAVILEVEAPAAPIRDPWGNLRTAASGTTRINRQDFGVKWSGKMDNGGLVVGDEVSITLDIEMIRKPPAEPGK